jgi:hypothetical protein
MIQKKNACTIFKLLMFPLIYLFVISDFVEWTSKALKGGERERGS